MLQQWDHLNEACLVVVHQKAVHVGYHGAAIHIGTSNLLHIEHLHRILSHSSDSKMEKPICYGRVFSESGFWIAIAIL